MKKLTIEDILEQKKISKKVEMTFKSEVLNREIDFEKIDASKVMEILQDSQSGMLDYHSANMYLIYLSVPIFRNEKIRADMENKNDSPYKVVEEIFNSNIMEITSFADKILSIYGFTAEKVKSLKK